ncbi:hypothetical protein ACIQB5_30630 [Streptomyces sp. NPDC088560]|uniref:hypothetical protein n=1 Tax=Streptomyces sp. NPDC088560 TaxID=3365868 RepID=UPI00381F5B5B
MWFTIGFQSFQDGVHFLDCHLKRLQGLLAARQQEFTELCHSWRKQHPLLRTK